MTGLIDIDIAVGCSLQGGLEEPIATRVARFLTGLLIEAYPTGRTILYCRDNYPGMGDCYSRMKADIDNQNPDITHHVHVDAYTPGSYGFSCLYDSRYDTPGYAEDIICGLNSTIGGKYSKSRGISDRASNGVAVLKRKVCTLSEVGFYTNPAELELMQQEWYCALIAWGLYLGMESQIFERYGVRPEKEEEEDMVRFQEVGKNTYSCARIGGDNIMYIHAESATDVELDFYGIQDKKDTICTTKGAGGWDNKTKWHGADYKVSEAMPGFEIGRVTIHAPCALSIEVG